MNDESAAAALIARHDSDREHTHDLQRAMRDLVLETIEAHPDLALMDLLAICRAVGGFGRGTLRGEVLEDTFRLLRVEGDLATKPGPRGSVLYRLADAEHRPPRLDLRHLADARPDAHDPEEGPR